MEVARDGDKHGWKPVGHDDWMDLLDMDLLEEPASKKEAATKSKPEPSPEPNPEPNHEPAWKKLKFNSKEYDEWLESQIE